MLVGTQRLVASTPWATPWANPPGTCVPAQSTNVWLERRCRGFGNTAEQYEMSTVHTAEAPGSRGRVSEEGVSCVLFGAYCEGPRDGVPLQEGSQMRAPGAGTQTTPLGGARRSWASLSSCCLAPGALRSCHVSLWHLPAITGQCRKVLTLGQPLSC